MAQGERLRMQRADVEKPVRAGKDEVEDGRPVGLGRHTGTPLSDPGSPPRPI